MSTTGSWCYFDTIRVPATLDENNSLTCIAPPHPPGSISVFVMVSNIISPKIEFSYFAGPAFASKTILQGNGLCSNDPCPVCLSQKFQIVTADDQGYLPNSTANISLKMNYTDPDVKVDFNISQQNISAFLVYYLPPIAGKYTISVVVNGLAVSPEVVAVVSDSPIQITAFSPANVKVNTSQIITINGSGFVECGGISIPDKYRIKCEFKETYSLMLYSFPPIFITSDYILCQIQPTMGVGSYLVSISMGNYSSQCALEILKVGTGICPDDCNRNGICIIDSCRCYTMWTGTHCEIPIGYLLIGLIAILILVIVVLILIIRKCYRKNSSQPIPFQNLCSVPADITLSQRITLIS